MIIRAQTLRNGIKKPRPPALPLAATLLSSDNSPPKTSLPEEAWLPLLALGCLSRPSYRCRRWTSCCPLHRHLHHHWCPSAPFKVICHSYFIVITYAIGNASTVTLGTTIIVGNKNYPSFTAKTDVSSRGGRPSFVLSPRSPWTRNSILQRPCIFPLIRGLTGPVGQPFASRLGGQRFASRLEPRSSCFGGPAIPVPYKVSLLQ